MTRPLTRRGFLEMTSVAAVGSSAMATNAPTAEAAASEKPKPRLFELGTVTYNIARDWDLETLIEKCEELELKAVELRSTHAHGVEPDISAHARQKVRQRFHNTAVVLFGLGSACEFHSPDANVVRSNIERTKKFLQLAHDVGALGVKVRPNGLATKNGVPEGTTLQQIGHALAECGQRAESLGVEVWLEVHGRDTKEPKKIRKIIDACGHPSVGVTWNSNQEDILNGSIRKSFELLAKDVRCVHVHDLWADYPYRELFGLLRKIGYDRYTMIEMSASPDIDRLMKYYRALWEELSRP